MPTCVRLAAHADVSVVACDLRSLVVGRLVQVRDLGVFLRQKGHCLSQVTIADLFLRTETGNYKGKTGSSVLEVAVIKKRKRTLFIQKVQGIKLELEKKSTTRKASLIF